MISLKERLELALGSRGKRWYPGLAGDLANEAWARLASRGIHQDQYCVATLFGEEAGAARLHAFMSDASGPIVIEPFEEALQDHYLPLGLETPGGAFRISSFVEDCEAAYAVLGRIGGVGDAVRHLVRTITPVAVSDPELDISFSDPEAPFSVFIGAHPPEHQVSILRFAEGLLHETMHLQLSLIEGVTPLILGSEFKHHSPWRGEARPTYGLLHGLYVFRAIQDFLKAALAEQVLAASDRGQAQKRVLEIDLECEALADLGTSQDLTPYGRKLVASLLDP